MQVVNALIKANKNFDLLVIPGGEHGAGRSGVAPEYGEHKRFDYFVQHLYQQLAPEWNNEPTTAASPSAQPLELYPNQFPQQQDQFPDLEPR